MSLLDVENLFVSYGPVAALRGVSLRVEEGEAVALIGANGAGKSTLLRTLSGLSVPTSGTIQFAGESLVRQPAHRIARWGLAQVPERRGLFANLTVEENLELGRLRHRDAGMFSKSRDRAIGLFPILGERLAQSAGTLSGGEQQMLALARALITRPRLLLLDEPSLGLAPRVVQQILRVLGEINRDGTTLLLVEQNAHLALRLAHRAYVLELGQVQSQGPASELAASDAIAKAYLGTSSNRSADDNA